MKNWAVIFFLFSVHFSFAQKKQQETFQRITSTLKDFQVNKTSVPEDQLTREIRKLRLTKGGFNINEALLFKVGEDLEKGEISKSEAEKLKEYFASGKGKSDLDNAVIWIYRELFTASEIRKLTRFYKSSAGQKFSENFPVIMLESLKAAEEIVKEYRKTN